MLSDTRIRDFMESGDIVFTDADGGPLDLDDSQFQPVSVDLRLGELAPGVGWSRKGDSGRVWRLPPFLFTLASTLEVVTLSTRISGLAIGKSSIARKGLQVEAAGLVDPGFSGQLTLELIHFGWGSIPLTEDAPICQMFFFEVDGLVERPYGTGGLQSRYQHQRGPTAAR
jgi:deoxycytidine triphosphate deaminase